MIVFLFFSIPIAAVIFFISSLHRFLSAREQSKRQPGSVDEEVLKKRKVTMIGSSVIAGVLVAAVISFIILLSSALMNM